MPNSLPFSFSSLFQRKMAVQPIKYVNYNCEECMKPNNAIPNMGGRFFLINESQCQCNGCGTVYNKTEKYVSAADM
jgi:hypothetical protein